MIVDDLAREKLAGIEIEKIHSDPDGYFAEVKLAGQSSVFLGQYSNYWDIYLDAVEVLIRHESDPAVAEAIFNIGQEKQLRSMK